MMTEPEVIRELMGKWNDINRSLRQSNPSATDEQIQELATEWMNRALFGQLTA